MEINADTLLELRKMLEYVPDMVFLIDVKKQDAPKLLRSAGMLATEFKLETEDIGGQPLKQALRMPDVLDNLPKAVKGETVTFDLEYRERRFECTLRPFDDFDKNIHEVIGSLKETTALYHKSNYAKGLSGLLNLIDEPVALFDTDFKLVGFNPRMGTLFGYDEEELVGEDFKKLLSSANPEEFISQILPKTLTTGWEGELRGIKKSGVEFPLEARTQAVRDEKGDFLYMACIMRDLSRYIGKGQEQAQVRERELMSLDLNSYAESVQLTLEPDQEKFSRILPENIVLQRSNQTLSRNLAWMSTQFNAAYLALLQAEGNGILGPLETFTGFKALNQIVMQEMVLDPNRMLSRLDESLQLVIDEEVDIDEEDAKGLQVYFLGYDPEKQALKSAGAGLDMLVLKADKAKWFEGAPKGLGIETDADERLFNPQSLNLDSGDIVLLCACTLFDAREGEDSNDPMGRAGVLDKLKAMREMSWDDFQTELRQWFSTLVPADRSEIDLMLVCFRAP